MKRRRAAIVVIAVLAALVIYVLYNQPRKKDGGTARADDDPSPTRPLDEHHQAPPTAPPASVASAEPDAAPDPPPIIDDIALEKTEVCAGEENMVTVKAHTPNGTDEFLHYVIDGQLGSQFPVRLWRNEQGDVVGQHSISVFGRGNTSVTAPLPRYKVKDCQPLRMVGIETRVRANTWGEYEMQAKVVVLPPLHGDKHPTPPKPFVPAAFVWSFGDGETTTTTTPLASHDYETRKQDSLYSYFTVGVAVHGKDGEVIQGRTMLSLINPAFEALKVKGVVALMIALEPRFPELKGGVVTQQVRLWHHRPGTVTIDQAVRTKYFEGGGESAPEPVDVASVLGTATIPAGKDGVTTRVVLDTNAEPGVMLVTYRLAGKSDEGYPAWGSFSVMRPPPKPTAESSDPVHDPMLKAKILAARTILQKDVVTDEDIWRLEREGRLANVAPAPGSSAHPPMPQPLPRNPPSDPVRPVPTGTGGPPPPPAGGAPAASK